MGRIHYMAAVAIFAASLAGHANATFMVDPNAATDGSKLFLTAAKDATSSTGSVVTADDVNINVTGPSNFASGYANIVPVMGGSLTDLIFTPVNPAQFDSFSFRGESIQTGVNLDLIVTDQTGATQTFVFPIAMGNQDFGSLGIISTDGETIKSVELSLPTGFEEGKQFQFDCASVAGAAATACGVAIPEPATWALMLVGVTGLGAVMRFRRRALASAV